MTIVPIKLPDEAVGYQQDADQATFSLISWHVEVGDAVTTGQALFEYEADKTAGTAESQVSGVVKEILFSADPSRKLSYDTVIGYLETP